MYGKRLETIDGVEIASSYKEYIDLALGDLCDRLKKSKVKVTDLRERISKRETLFSQITKEINRRKVLSLELTEKDKILRDRLIRNTEMKSAIQNLADIAGYKLDTPKNSLKAEYETDNSVQDTAQIMKNSETILSDSGSNLFNKLKNSSYTIYIGMAYSEVNEILAKDKQVIIELIRKKINNDFKTKELEKLRDKVGNSLKRLKNFESKLNDIINHDTSIDNVLRQLSNVSNFDKEKILSILKNLPQDGTQTTDQNINL